MTKDEVFKIGDKVQFKNPKLVGGKTFTITYVPAFPDMSPYKIKGPEGGTSTAHGMLLKKV